MDSSFIRSCGPLRARTMWRILIAILIVLLILLMTICAVLLIRALTWKQSSWIEELRPKNVESVQRLPEAGREERLQRFKQLLRFRTISYDYNSSYPGAHDTTAAFEDLRNFLDDAFPLLHNGTYSFVTYETVSNFSRLYTIKGSDPSLHPILLCAHTDVVPVDAPENWDAPPFGADEVVEDGKTYIYGRGAIDDKHAVMGILEATDYFLKERGQPVRGIVIAIGHDEEIRGKHGAGQMAKKLEERSFRFEFILDEGFMVLQGLFPGLADPVALVGISEKGYATVQLTIKSMSSGHSSMPAKETAIGTLSKAIGRLEDQPQPSQFVRDSPEYSMIEALAEHVSFGYRLVYTNLWLFRPIVAMIMGGTPSTAATMRTTSVTTMFHAGVKVNLVPSSASAMLNHRIHPMQSLDSVLAYDRQVIADERITLNVTSYSAPHYISPYGEDVWAYRALSKSILEVFPSVATVVPATLVGNTDTKWYLNLTDTVYRFAPSYFMKDDPKRFHGDNERISVKNFHEAVDFYFRLLLNIQVGEEWEQVL